MASDVDQSYEMELGLWHRRKGEVLRPDAEDEDDIAQLQKTLVNPDVDKRYQQDQRASSTSDHGGAFPIFAPDTIAHLPQVLSIDAGTTPADDASFSGEFERGH